MTQQAILKSDLLDIIFENRNKDYGAYALRKTYRYRLAIAVLVMAVVVASLSLFLSLQTPNDFLNTTHVEIISDPVVSVYHPTTQPAAKKLLIKHAAMKALGKIDRPPVIVAFAEINNLPATQGETEPSFLEGNPGLNSGVAGEGRGVDSLNSNPVNPQSAAPDESNPLEIAEIMPQYPGGLAALLSFLKKNLHSPADVQDGEEISVKVEFVVNYNGNLGNFNVTKSGGEVFDNEVIRVLKKMPRWTPGRSKGKNVAVYYTVPVKFTIGF